MQPNPIVFLDFDGVINTRFYYYENGKLCGKFYHEEDMKVNNIEAINLLNRLCLDTNADIVVTSSWRKHTSKNSEFSTKKVLINSGLDLQINVLGDAPILDTSIGDEVRLWLTENDYPLDHPFIIIDDGCDPKEFNDRYIKTTFEKGFTVKEYLIALNRLNGLMHQKRLFIKK